MNRQELKKRRGERLTQLLKSKRGPKNALLLAQALATTEDPLEVRRLHILIKRCKATRTATVKQLLPAHLAIRIARLYTDTQPSWLYVELLPEEQEQPDVESPVQPELDAEPSTPHPTTTATAGPTVTIPALGIKDLPVESKLLHSKKGFVIRFQVRVTIEQMRKLVEGKL